ncbi:hypothetical protein [Novosphingobium sp. ST904]|nr:hypothetical protein [Novosphingobium sp. ST904]TCM33784.1 hypothetical protein EDF59_119100 [Novosphingobium sp. ST904]
MDDGMVCCECCGDDFAPEDMATAEFCHECIEAVDMQSEDEG